YSVFLGFARLQLSSSEKQSQTKLKRVCERTIPFDPWRLTGFQSVSGSCSIICKSWSTSFISTNDLFTAWKTYGATRPDWNGKRLRRPDPTLQQSAVSRAQPRKAGAILRSSESPLYFFGDGEAAGLGAAFG